MNTIEYESENVFWCSWCYTKTSHIAYSAKRVKRSQYICGECNQPTVRCMAYKCPNMARSTGRSSDKFCEVHAGQIGSFETLTSRISDPTEFTALLAQKDGVNWVKASNVVGLGLSGAVVMVPLSVIAAPAIGGAIGSTIFGLSGAAASSAGLALLGGGSLASGGFGMLGGTVFISALGSCAGSAAAGLLVNSFLADVKGFEIVKVRDGKDPALICIDGFLTENTKGEDRWLNAFMKYKKNHAIYYVKWESKTLSKLGSIIVKGTAQGALKKLAESYAAKAVRSAGAKMHALTIPLELCGLIKNPWTIALRKAEQTGELLKEMIVRCENRSFILYGHSLGARVIYRALSSYGTIEKGKRRSRIISAHLLGGAVGTSRALDWEYATRAVEERLYSYRSRNDRVLRWLYNPGTLFASPAIGRRSIPVCKSTQDKIVNFDVSDLVSGHTCYHDAIRKVLALSFG